MKKIIFFTVSMAIFSACTKEIVRSVSEETPVRLKDLNIFYGDLHQHTTLSDGNVDIEDNLKYIKENKVLDFVAITDHSQYYDHPEDWARSESWKKIVETTAKYNENGVFIALPAFEWSKNSSTGTGGTGHINTFATKWWATANTDEMSVENYYKMLVDDPNSISMFNHPSTKNFNSFGFHNPEIDKRITIFEIATRSGRPTFKPRLEAYVHALDKGWHLAPADNTDTHLGFWWATNCFGRTAIIAKELTRESLYEAMRKRRLYATYDRNIRMNFSINNELMGSILNKPNELKVLIELEDPDENDNFSKVEVLTEGGEVVAARDFESNSVVWELNLDPAKKYYFLRVTQADKDLAFSAPIWTGY
jgi:hypothetical protein